MTTGVLRTAAVVGRQDGAAFSGESSDLGVPLRAESAAKGETKGRGGAVGSDFFGSDFWASNFWGSGAIVNLRFPAGARSASTPLNNCSIGNNLCACASFKTPTSR